MRSLLLPVLLAVAASAQTPSEPPSLIRFHRAGAAASVRARLIQPYMDAQAPATVLNLDVISGPAETWLVEAIDSFAVLEQVDKALSSAEGAQPGVRFIAVYRANLSYRPEEAIKLFPRARYYMITLFHSRPGTGADVAEWIRIRHAGYDTVNLDRPDMAYQVISGIQTPAFVFVTPLVSLNTLDDAIAKWPVYADRAGAEGAKTSQKIAYDAEVTRESFLMRVDPANSFVSEGFASADPEFWGGKPPSQ